MALLSYTQFLNEKLQFNTSWIFESVLNEGGAYGHLNHPFEDMELTMEDFKEMILATVHGLFTPENFITEKTDGQNLMFSWKDGELIGARNKGHLKNFGEKALDINGIVEMFKGRGEIEVAFRTAMEDLSGAISKLRDEDKILLFNNGEKFGSVEVITPRTQNVIPYGQDMLVFHGILTYNQAGEPIDNDKEAGNILGNLIKAANADVQSTFYVRGPKNIESIPLPNAGELEKKFIGKINELVQNAGIKWDSTLGDYVAAMGKMQLSKMIKDAGHTILPDFVDLLVKRLYFDDKSYKVPNIKKDLGTAADWYIELEKTEGAKLKKEIIKPVEYLFLEVGTTFLKNINTFLAANPTEATLTMRQEIENAIKQIQASNDTVKIEKLNRELERIAAVGGLDSIVPSEGITFVWKGKQYKYTGIFAPINQLRGMLVYSK
jgi:hypothetical protein